MAKTDIWMPIFIGDYLRDTSRLSPGSHGAYLLLLMHQWIEGSLPSNEKELMRIVKAFPDEWPDLWNPIKHFFDEEDGSLYQRRLQRERELSMARRETRQKNGKKGGRPKSKEVQQEPTNNLEVNQGDNLDRNLQKTTSPSPSQVTTNVVTKDIAPSSDELESGDSDPDPVVAKLPTNRINTIGEKFPITQSMLDDWIETYPGVDVRKELRAMYGWLMANQAKRKTITGMAKFINAWLAREQNRGGSNGKSTDNGPGGTGRPTDTRRLSGAERTRLAREQARSREAAAR